ncbi:hypothetical protein ACN28S_14095 [Cystobacter fuscus]
MPDKIVGHCIYTNKFSSSMECRDYVGEWSEQDAKEDCEDQGSTIVLGSACGMEERLGYCFLEEGSDRWTRITLPGVNQEKCGSMQRGCELFGGGAFEPAPVCGGRWWTAEARGCRRSSNRCSRVWTPSRGSRRASRKEARSARGR